MDVTNCAGCGRIDGECRCPSPTNNVPWFFGKPLNAPHTLTAPPNASAAAADDVLTGLPPALAAWANHCRTLAPTEYVTIEGGEVVPLREIAYYLRACDTLVALLREQETYFSLKWEMPDEVHQIPTEVATRIADEARTRLTALRAEDQTNE